MTLEEAIGCMERHYVLHLDVPRAQLDKASKLGIEALKFKQAIRAHTVDDFDALLTGETKEEKDVRA